MELRQILVSSTHIYYIIYFIIGSVIGLSGNVLTNRLIQSSLVQLVNETTPLLSLKEMLKEIMFSFDVCKLVVMNGCIT